MGPSDMKSVGQWWHSPDHYDWLSEYLSSRGLLRYIRSMMAGIVVSLALISIAMLWSPSGPQGRVGLLTVAVVVIACTAMTVLWTRSWPTRRQSALFAALANVCVAAACLVQANPVAALIGCVSFTMLNGYVAFFHTVRVLATNIALSVATILFLGVRVAVEHSDPILAATKTYLVIMAVVSVPVVAQAMVKHLGDDVADSDVDLLSGLLNRRAFHRWAGELIMASRGDARHQILAMTMVDLDHFKLINDTRGHLAGDHVLAEVADILRLVSGGTAVIGRSGGEEFVIADVYRPGDTNEIADRLRRAIADSPIGVTASIGVATTPVSDIPTDAVAMTIDSLVHDADTAMYAAKRSGGNQWMSYDGLSVAESGPLSNIRPA